MDFNDVIYVIYVSCDVLQTFSCHICALTLVQNACDYEVGLIMGDLGDAFITWALKGKVHPKMNLSYCLLPPVLLESRVNCCSLRNFHSQTLLQRSSKKSEVL